MSEAVGRDGTGKHAVSPSCNYQHQYSAGNSKTLVLSLFPSELNLLRKQETCLLLLLFRRRWISPLLHHHYLLMNLLPLVSSYSACRTVYSFVEIPLYICTELCCYSTYCNLLKLFNALTFKSLFTQTLYPFYPATLLRLRPT